MKRKWCKWTRCWWKKRMLRKKKVLNHIWVKFESDLDQILTKSLTSFNQSWYTHNIELITALKKRFVYLSTSASVLTTSYVQLITFFILEFEWSRILIICFNCKASNHLLKNCSQLKTSTSTSCAFIFCLNEIIMLKEEKKLFTEKLKNEAKN